MTFDAVMTRAVIFDCDGVLANTEQLKYLAWKQAFGELRPFSCDLDLKTYAPCVGLSSNAIAVQLLQHFRIANLVSVVEYIVGRRDAIYRTLRASVDLHTFPLPGVGLFAALRTKYPNIKLAVVSSGSHDELEQSLNDLGLAHTDSLVTVSRNDVEARFPDEAEPLKPKPHPYLYAMEQLRVTPAECVVVEDTAAGVTAAMCAGITSIFVMSNKLGYVVNQADMVRVLGWDACVHAPDAVCEDMLQSGVIA